jgi:hypothetical protein
MLEELFFNIEELIGNSRLFMPDHFLLKKTSLWNRRQLLKLGLAGIGVTGAAVAVQQFAQHGLLTGNGW